jgi:hypothetical protein
MAKYPYQSAYAGFNNNPIYFADPTGLEGDPPVKTIKNDEGQVVDPNGNPSDFAEDWFAAVEGNLVMTNGTDYQVWNPATGKYDKGRAPKDHRGSSETSYDELPSDVQIGDTYEQYLYDPYGVLFTAAGDSRTLQYVGELNWVVLEDFDSATHREIAASFLPIGSGTSRLLSWIGKTYAGKQIINAASKMCFVKGTLVHTDEGLKEIQDIIIGDKVWSFNENTSEKELKEVVSLSDNISEELIEIYFENEKLVCTPEHPFYVGDKWIEAKDLKLIDKVTLKNGSLSQIITLKKLKISVPVYNFEVEDNHNYYVSESAVLVHNNNCTKVLGLGNRRDFWRLRDKGALVYEGNAWFNKGLTDIDNYDAAGKFWDAFYQATKKADAIRFELTSFNSKLNPITAMELRIIKSRPDLLKKTTFIRDGAEYIWDGVKMVPK